ncbi:MAG: glutamate dehydrogenase [Lysobacteraceae bacterium SCN 69-123]|nr:MAG: glutamate dehydrogenase [Xanthomonadaceae bacterium SCN 69-123]
MSTADRTLLDPILDALNRRLPAPRQGDAAALARRFFGRMPEDELAARSPELWAALVADLLEFMRERRPGAPKLRIFNTQASEGWDSAHTVVQIVNDDMPFLVDSVSMAVAACELQLHAIIHPVLQVQRDPGGHVLGLGERGADESVMHLEIDRLAEPEDLRRVQETILNALADVRSCVRDWSPMRERMLATIAAMDARPMPISEEGRREAQEFLRWAADDHFTFLGYREYRRDDSTGEDLLYAVQGTGLGILSGKDATAKPRPLKTLAATHMPQSGAVGALILTKTNARSSVHRPGYMDYIGVLVFDESGRAVAEHRFLGLYTSSAYASRPWTIPLVRQRYEHVMRESGLAPNSHSGKSLRHILESLPRDELFQSGEDELYQTALGILALQERARARLFLRRDRYGRFYSALIYIPRDRYNTDVRLRTEALLREALHGERLDTNVQMGDSPLAQLHMIVRPRAGESVEVDVAAVEARLAQIVRNWHDELRDLLVQSHGEERGLKLTQRYGKALPVGYIEQASPEVAAADVEQAAALHGPEDLRLRLYRSSRETGSRLRFKLFRYGSPIVLSDALPMMENMGLRILSEHPFEMEVASESIYIQDFEVVSGQEQVGFGSLDVEALRGRFEDAFEHIWRGQAESDGFNALILSAGLDWRQVSMLRGYCKYLLQAQAPFSQAYMEATLNRYPLIARVLVEYFHALFDPSRLTESEAERSEGATALRAGLLNVAGNDPGEAVLAQIDAVAQARGLDSGALVDVCDDALGVLLEGVSSLDEDRILRSFLGVMQATLRTSYFQRPGGRHRDYISFKFDPNAVPELPKPRPYREIFVYGPRVEGVHLRYGPVARGGLRWSDRREDFRTEVLGLVKAQMVKNTVIVPVGAKGGFYAKRPPVGGDRDAILAEGIACYRLFINGLLDITDNLNDAGVIHPQDVVRRDGDDPYLVVAADKGTATFSDIANAISQEHGFWLGDAFASGGSVGYDHKGMGITAKGGWESVKRHFRAMGRDSQGEDFSCVGIGDMSGDVFGNGMLLSKHIRLVAAFDHRHVFLDPNPDAARSYVERERLFKLPRSSWEDYDKSLISAGGGVYARSLKSIPISPQVREVLGLGEGVSALSPNDLLTAILKAPVDLLWNGGIGTYVKASSETHAEVGDRANNAIRVNGNELRCRVVGEGGNLGMTQKGRIEAALNGVLLNTDFIDNSAGVDTSDHEVNIKILLNDAVTRGELSTPDRNVLLAEMTGEVEQLVLNDNYRQNQAISMMERMSVYRLGSKQHFIRTLEGQGLLDRQLEYLPSDAEFSERKARGLGLTRPELSILLSYSKIVAFQQLLESDVPEDPYLSKELVRYFPQALQERYAEHMQRHRLRREIIATAVTNSMVNRMGATFLMRMQEDTGRSPAQIAKAYSIAREVLDARGLWADIDALDLAVPESAQIDALLEIWALLRSMTRWLLNRPGDRFDIAEAVGRYHPGIEALRGALPEILSETDRSRFAEACARWQEAGLPQALAQQLATLSMLYSALDVVEVASVHSLPVTDVARVYSGLGEALHLQWLLQKIEELPVEGRWHALARGSMRDEMQQQQGALVAQVLRHGKGDVGKRLASWLGRDDTALKFTLSMFADMRTQLAMDYPTVSVAVRRLAQLAAAGSA